jgi:hypothetical protein
MTTSKTSTRPTGKRHGFEYHKQDRNRFTSRKSLGEVSARLSVVIAGHRYFLMTNHFSSRIEAEKFAKKYKGARKTLHYRIVKRVAADGSDHFLVAVRYTDIGKKGRK